MVGASAEYGRAPASRSPGPPSPPCFPPGRSGHARAGPRARRVPPGAGAAGELRDLASNQPRIVRHGSGSTVLGGAGVGRHAAGRAARTARTRGLRPPLRTGEGAATDRRAGALRDALPDAGSVAVHSGAGRGPTGPITRVASAADPGMHGVGSGWPGLRGQRGRVDHQSRPEGSDNSRPAADPANSRSRQRHRRLLGGLLAEVAGGMESYLELSYARDVERPHGLPSGDRQTFHPGLPYERDVKYKRFGLIIELDGRLGHQGEGRFRDMNRDNRHALRAELTLRYGYFDVTNRACAVAYQVFLGARSARIRRDVPPLRTLCRRSRGVSATA